MSYSQEELRKIPNTLSESRFQTYLIAKNNDQQLALELYQWNLEISASFITPIHIFEVALRNAVIDAIEPVHGSNWAYNDGFIRSLPNPRNGYNAKQNLIKTSNRHSTTGKVVAELNFVFWEKMFTSRHDERLWNNHLKKIFPFAPKTESVSSIRGILHSEIFNIRKLRNRIAHHEPIFTRDLSSDYEMLLKLIKWRENTTGEWLDKIQEVTYLLQNKP